MSATPNAEPQKTDGWLLQAFWVKHALQVQHNRSRNTAEHNGGKLGRYNTKWELELDAAAALPLTRCL